jgi:phage terminase large subunit
LGERGISTINVFNTFKQVEKTPEGGKVIRALDFGYNDPSALVECKVIDDNLYIKELLYLRGLTSDDLVYKIQELGIDLTDDLWCDSARPEIIEDLKRKGINAKPVKKHTILHGIDLIKRHKVYITENSKNIWNEFNSYKWKTNKDNKTLDIPEDDNNHAIDAIRYCLEMYNKPKTTYHFL